ncbi:MAG: hypothetical protein EXX96DRAFT_136222 [Benjaminiella poitrasii]|nr:MAG: hypothetical protein EXX96DRAFT_136222 [Benjaminiella poitrasii]
MNRNNTNNSEHRANKIPNYAQVAKSNQQQQQQPQQSQTRNQQPQQQGQQSNLEQSNYTKSPNKYNNYKSGGMTQTSYQNYKSPYPYNTYNKTKENTPYVSRKPSLQLPMAPPTDTAPIQFGSINQPPNNSQQQATPTSPATTTGSRTSDTSAGTRTTEVQFGSLPAVTDTSSSFNYRSRASHQQKPEIPRSPRNTNHDGRLFTQPYVPRQGESQYNHNRYYNNYRNNGYNRPNTQPHHSPNQPYHHQYSSAHQPQRSPQQQSTLPPSPMNHRTSPNQAAYSPTKKNTLSPHIPQGSPQNIQMTAAWSAGQYFYPPQYPVTVPYNVPQQARQAFIPPSTTRKVIAIINPDTGVAVDTSPMSLNSNTTTATSSSNQNKEDKEPVFVKPTLVSKAVSIVDPAIREREKREREEAEREAKRKAEEEKKEAERKAQEEKEREERKRKEEQERLERERLEKERKEEEERLEKERLEAERLEKERLEAERLEKEKLEAERLEAERARLAEEAAAAAAAALEKQKKEEEMRRKAEEEQESKRVISELEAEKKKQEASDSLALNTTGLQLSQSPVSSPTVTTKQPMKLIEDPETIEYPPGIKAPTKSDYNKHVYSIDFLLQFQQFCSVTDVDLSAINIREDHGGSGYGSRSSSMRQASDRGRGSRNQGGNNNFSSDSMYKMGSRDGRMEMGKFNMGRPLAVRNNSSHMERQGSHGASRGGMMGRGGGRGGGSGGMKIIRNPPQQNAGPAPPLEPVAPLEKSENRWVPRTPAQAAQAAQAPAEGELMSQEYITRKVNALLNKLTLEKFDSISNQIFDYARQSSKEEDGQSLRTVIKLTFEKACDEPNFATMWARLCRKMYDSMTEDIRDTSILDEKGNPSCGIPLFRKYLFNRCQVEFEKGWKVNMPKLDDDTMMTEEYYAAAKAKRQGLGLIQFIGELFKLEMLSERIMYGCLIKLCNDPSNAGDEEAESLCKLLTTIGKALDSKQKTSKWVDIVITRMKNEMINSPNLTSRVKFMIQDLLDLRRDKWIPRHGNTQVGPMTIAKIHEMAEKAKGEKEAAAAMKRNNSSRGQYPQNNNQYNNNSNNNNNSHSLSRAGSYRNSGGNYQSYNANNANNANNTNASNNNSGDGWSTVSPGASKTRTNELSNFGKMDRSRSRTNILGPSNSPFPSLSRGKSAASVDTKGSIDGRASPATNMFSALSASTSEKTDERKKLQLTPRTVTESKSDEKDVDESVEKSPAETTSKLSDEVVKRKSKNILEEYLNLNDKAEFSECVKELDDPDYLIIFIGEMLTFVEKKAQDVEKISEGIKYLNSQGLLEKELYIKAFKSFMEGYDDLTIDVPQAPKYVAQLLHASSVTPEEVDGDSYESLQKAYSALNDN